LAAAGYASPTNITAGTITTATNVTNLVTANVTQIAGAAALDALNAVKLASDGLDAVSISAPTGVANDFREMMIQVWRRLFAKHTLTVSELKTFADNESTVLTTQTVSDDGATQEIGAAT